MRWNVLIFALFVVAAGACVPGSGAEDATAPDAAALDTLPAVDAEPDDDAAPDAGDDAAATDAREEDATADALPADAATEEADVVAADAGEPMRGDGDVDDARTDAPEAGPRDAAAGRDAGPRDAIPPDIGSGGLSCDVYTRVGFAPRGPGYRTRIAADSTNGLTTPHALTYAGGAFGGRVLIANQNGEIVSLDPVTGQSTPFIDLRDVTVPHSTVTAMAWDSTGALGGDLFVADRGRIQDGDSIIFRVTPSGAASVFARGAGLVVPEMTPGLNDVSSLAVSPGGAYPPGLYVTGLTVGANVPGWGRISSTGTISAFGRPGRVEVHAIAFDTTGRFGGGLLAALNGAVNGQETLTEILPDGSTGRTFGADSYTMTSLAFANGGRLGDTLFTRTRSGVLYTIDPSGVFTSRGFSTIGTGGVTVTPDGNVAYVAFRDEQRVYCVDRVGPPPCVPGVSPERLNSTPAGNRGNNQSTAKGKVSLSADGRYAAFDSTSSDLVPGDTNGVADVFVRDRWLGTTERVSRGLAGLEANGASTRPYLTPDGRFVAFITRATNLVVGDTQQGEAIVVLDRASGVITLESIDVFGRPRRSGDTDQGTVSLSADGRYLAFTFAADGLVPEDANGEQDVFVRDRATGTTQLVSVTLDGVSTNDHSRFAQISDDGSLVAFSSEGARLVEEPKAALTELYVRDVFAGVTTRVIRGVPSSRRGGIVEYPSFSSDGRWLAFSTGGDLDGSGYAGASSAFVADLLTGTFERVSVSSAWVPAGGWAPSLSADGRYVSFTSPSAALTDPSQGDDYEGASDIYVRDRALGLTTRISVDWLGDPISSDGASTISGDGSRVAWTARTSMETDVLAASRFSCGAPVPGLDGGVPDAAPDAGAGDALASDAMIGADASPPDTSSVDAGAADAGAIDAGVADAGGVPGRDARLLRQRLPGLMMRREVRPAEVVLENRGTGPWPAGGAVQLGSLSSPPALFGASTIPLGVVTPPGASATFAWSVTAPATPGAYVHAWSMIDASRPFGEIARQPVRVAACPGAYRASVNSALVSGNSQSGGLERPAISGDGRYVGFIAYGSNLIAGGVVGQQAFVHDQATGETLLIGVNSQGRVSEGACSAIALSADGATVAFTCSGANLDGVNGSGGGTYVRPLRGAPAVYAGFSVGGRQIGCGLQDMSTTARYLALRCSEQIFLRDMLLSRTTSISVAAGGGLPNGSSSFASVSDDGRWVVFRSYATNLIDPPVAGGPFLYARDVVTGRTMIVDANAQGVPANAPEPYGAVSPDGRFVAFTSVATNLVPGVGRPGLNNLYTKDLQTGAVTFIAEQPLAGSTLHVPDVSADGRFIVFGYNVRAEMQTFVHDRQTGMTAQVNRNDLGVAGDNASRGPAMICADGRFIAYGSSATNLAAGELVSENGLQTYVSPNPLLCP